MALSAKLQIRQSQGLVMTPQLLQSIRLLQLSQAELASFIDRELEKNPLLERDEEEAGDVSKPAEGADADEGAVDVGPAASGLDEQFGEGLSTRTDRLEADLDTSLDNVFDADMPPPRLSGDPWKAPAVSAGSGERDDLQSGHAAPIGLREHLVAQLPLAVRDTGERIVAVAIVDSLDDDGYMRRPLDELADQLGLAPSRIETVLAAVQGLDPAGVAARDLGECLALQLRERDRLDPAMQAFLANLDLVARHDFAALAKVCGVDRDDLADMLAEIRALDPKPGSAFAADASPPVVADVAVNPAADGGWAVELNAEALPRVLVNRDYHARVAPACRSEADKTFIADCLQSANWLTRSLDQRAQTILKVSTEIVRQQDMFLAFGVEHLRPLNLKDVAEAISMHESTVSRVTANKYMMTPRGLFELKYFFTTAIASTAGEASHSAEAVRHRIRRMIDEEDGTAVLSDDAIVDLLRADGVDLARRTVAKYREAMRIPSSVQRRREKRALSASSVA